MNDKELVSYFYTHSRTERALFAREHVVRMMKLAGKTAEKPEHWPKFVTVRQQTADYWIDLAERRESFKVIEGGKK